MNAMQCAFNSNYSYSSNLSSLAASPSLPLLPSPCFPTTTLLNTALLRALVFRPSSLPGRPIHPVPARLATASRRPPLRESQAREGKGREAQPGRKDGSEDIAPRGRKEGR